ncbi:MAG: hypothetical protein ACI819_001578 [Neolewinella sp.]|jgi:hypothetical protein
MRIQRISSHKVSSQQLGKSGYFALTWSVSGGVILLSVRTQKIRTEPLSFLIFSEAHPRHLSSSVGQDVYGDNLRMERESFTTTATNPIFQQKKHIIYE